MEEKFNFKNSYFYKMKSKFFKKVLAYSYKNNLKKNNKTIDDHYEIIPQIIFKRS